MSKTNDKIWKEFKVGYLVDYKTKKTTGTGLFAIVHSTAYHEKDVEITDINNLNGLNYVTRSKFNNGLKCKIIDNGSYIINPAGTISFGAENANFFYQTEPYITGNKMYYIDTSFLPELTCIFIKSILEATFTSNYSFSDGMTPKRIFDKNIKLPVDSEGNPDWEYMENYINDIKIIASDKILKLESINNIEKNKIDISNWKEFSLKSLGFSNFHGKRIKKSDRIDGDIIFITAGKENCGVIGTIGNDIGIWHNPITVDMFGNCFYHDYDCFGDDNIYAFINDNISALSKRFIASSIDARNRNIFMYSDQFRQDNADTLSVLLPEKNGNPDWEYIETYMSQIEDRVKTKLNLLIY